MHSIACRVLAKILLESLAISIYDENLPESRCGFRANRATTDMVFVIRQFQETIPWTKQRTQSYYCRPSESYWHSEQDITLAYPVIAWIHPNVFTHSDPAAWETACADLSQWCPVSALFHSQRPKVCLCFGSDSLLQLHLNDAQSGKTRWGRWTRSVCKVLCGLLSLQWMAPASLLQGPGEAYK